MPPNALKENPAPVSAGTGRKDDVMRMKGTSYAHQIHQLR